MYKLTAESLIAADEEAVWRYTQTPELHRRWDLRFTDIEMLPHDGSDAAKRFRYATRIGFGMAIVGWGETVGKPNAHSSALKFGSEDPKSLIIEGAGSWNYKKTDGGIHFSTIYDYTVRYGWFGKFFDALIFRPIMIWATRWSFDRMRMWIEGIAGPETLLAAWTAKTAARLALGFCWIYEGLIPKILFVAPSEIDLVQHSNVFIGSAKETLFALGIVEIMFGIWLLCGKSERLAASVTTLFMIALSVLVLINEPNHLFDPMGGISKNIALIACALTVWLLAPYTPTGFRKFVDAHNNAIAHS